MAAGSICSMDKAKAYLVSNTDLEATLFVTAKIDKNGADDIVRFDFNRTLQYYQNKIGTNPEIMKVLSDSVAENLSCTKADNNWLEISRISFTFKSTSSNSKLVAVDKSANPVLLLTDFKIYPDIKYDLKFLTSEYQKLYEGEPMRSVLLT